MKTITRGLVMALILVGFLGLAAPHVADAQDKKDKGKAAATSTAVFEVYKDRGGECRFRLKDGDGHLLAISGKGYDKREDLMAVIDAIKKDSSRAKVEEEKK